MSECGKADTERILIKTKHEGDFFAYRVESAKDAVPVTRK
jgi:hypothetical protein